MKNRFPHLGQGKLVCQVSMQNNANAQIPHTMSTGKTPLLNLDPTTLTMRRPATRTDSFRFLIFRYSCHGSADSPIQLQFSVLGLTPPRCSRYND